MLWSKRVVACGARMKGKDIAARLAQVTLVALEIRNQKHEINYSLYNRCYDCKLDARGGKLTPRKGG
jgi:hypothetical protein